MKIVPIGMKAANEYVAAAFCATNLFGAHNAIIRHHKPVQRPHIRFANTLKFCVSVEDENGECCGVAICR